MRQFWTVEVPRRHQAASLAGLALGWKGGLLDASEILPNRITLIQATLYWLQYI